ncbi:MAG: hypothetical protein ACI4XH_01815 [Acutalibacteraceae bacterium]
MKKVMAVILSLIMVLSLSMIAFAAPGEFIESPSGKQAPVIVEYENESADCTARLILTPYADRASMPDDLRLNFEKAYGIIAGTTDLSTLNGGIVDYAKKVGAKVSDLAISDFFDLRYEDCNNHNPHGSFRIVVEPETLKRFVCLLHYYNGEWTIVSDAHVTHDGQYLEFTAKEFSPFAIVVNTGDGTTGGSGNENPVSPNTDDNNPVIICSAIMAVSACGIIAVLVTGKRKSRKA